MTWEFQSGGGQMETCDNRCVSSLRGKREAISQQKPFSFGEKSFSWVYRHQSGKEVPYHGSGCRFRIRLI